MDRQTLFNLLNDYFDDDELRDVCFELQVDYEDLGGTTKRGKARELITHMERRGRLAELAALSQRLRPQARPQAGTPAGSSPAPGAGKTKILYLAANPTETRKLRLDEEIREIDQALQKSPLRDRFAIEQQWAIRVADLQGHLLRYSPNIVHFSGHGSDSGEILLEDVAGYAQPVPARALGRLFSAFKDSIQCVVLNACYSEAQAQAIAEHVECVVGTSQAIGDPAAISFAMAFYQALGFGRDVKSAFELGCTQIDLEQLDDANTPVLISPRRDPATVKLVQDD